MLARLTPTVYQRLDRSGAELEADLTRLAFEERVAPFVVQRVGSMVGAFFAAGPVVDDRSAEATDRTRYRRFFHGALDGGVYLPPSALETIFVSTAIGSRELTRAEPALRAGFRAARRGR